MKTDSLFYLLFHLPPPLFFALIGAPDQGQSYRFESVEVKEAAFRIDGVFLPPEGATDQPVYQDWWQLWQEQQGQVLAALVAHLGQPLDSCELPLVTQVQRLGDQQLTTMQEDLPGLNSLVDLATWCEQVKPRL